MNGLAPHTEKIFEQASSLRCLEGYTLVGGTALALQLGHRLSEDLDFCRWKGRRNEQLAVAWPEIEKELSTLGAVQRNLMDYNHCDFTVAGVRLSFYDNNQLSAPAALKRLPILNSIYMADVASIGVMKLEVMSRRSTYRDYYDMYSILTSGISLASIISGAGKYTAHRLRTRDMLAVLVNAESLPEDIGFAQLRPIHDVDFEKMRQAIGEKVRQYMAESLRKAR